ncbi:MAG TPA: hypothetical protein VF163_02545, partial [Micromonosporaceae bacterium]
MRVRLAVVPVAIAVAFVGGCATAGDPAANPSSGAVQVSNGIGALDPIDILAKAEIALAKATAVRIHGDLFTFGESVRLDMSYTGNDYAGTMEAKGWTVELILVGSDYYTKGPVDYW